VLSSAFRDLRFLQNWSASTTENGLPPAIFSVENTDHAPVLDRRHSSCALFNFLLIQARLEEVRVDWQDLIRRLRSRDPTAQHEVYEAYRQRLYAALRRLDPLGTVDHADCIRDGIVDAFRELFDRPDSFDPTRTRSSDPLLAYLFGIARRRTIDHLRRLKRDAISHLDLSQMQANPEDTGDDADPLDLASVPPSARTLDQVIADLLEGRTTVKEFEEHVQLHIDLGDVLARLDQLTDRQRQVVLLKYLAELTTREIMQLLELTEDSVEGILRRARDVLRGKK
jgi:RNA polymerase sigma factor (sigma-70 family)